MVKFKRGDAVKVTSVPRGLPRWTLGKNGIVYQVGKFLFYGFEQLAYHVEFKNGFRGIYLARNLVKCIKQQDSVETLSNISGLSKENVETIWKSVKANNKLLMECERPHDFVPAEEGPFAKQRRTKCKGIVDGSHALFYKHGLKDGCK